MMSLLYKKKCRNQPLFGQGAGCVQALEQIHAMCQSRRQSRTLAANECFIFHAVVLDTTFLEGEGACHYSLIDVL